MAPTVQILAGLQLLGQQGGRSTSPFWLWLFVLIVVTVAAGVVLLMVRRRLIEGEGADQHSGTLMEQLRRMRDRGEISESEYDLTRRSIAARAAGREPPAPAAPVDRAGESGRVARPGYDLTGERLPERGREASADED